MKSLWQTWHWNSFGMPCLLAMWPRRSRARCISLPQTRHMNRSWAAISCWCRSRIVWKDRSHFRHGHRSPVPSLSSCCMFCKKITTTRNVKICGFTGITSLCKNCCIQQAFQANRIATSVTAYVPCTFVCENASLHTYRGLFLRLKSWARTCNAWHPFK